MLVLANRTYILEALLSYRYPSALQAGYHSTSKEALLRVGFLVPIVVRLGRELLVSPLG